MLAWPTSLVSVCPCMVQKGQAQPARAAPAQASRARPRANRRRDMPVIDGTPWVRARAPTRRPVGGPHVAIMPTRAGRGQAGAGKLPGFLLPSPPEGKEGKAGKAILRLLHILHLTGDSRRARVRRDLSR